MTDGDLELDVSPYASGGGGTVLEHLYGANSLSELLARLATQMRPPAKITARTGDSDVTTGGCPHPAAVASTVWTNPVEIGQSVRTWS
jgi:hypothetical protein